MITAGTIYLIGILSNICTSLILIGITLGFTAFIYKATMDDNAKRNVIVTTLGGCILCFILSALIPSSKTAAAMVIIPKLTSNQSIQDISDNTIISLKLLTEKWIKELTTNENK